MSERKDFLKARLRREREKIAEFEKKRSSKMKKNLTADERKQRTQTLKERRIQSHLKKMRKVEENSPEETRKQDVEMLEEITMERAKRKAEKIQNKITEKEKRIEAFTAQESDTKEEQARKAKEKKQYEDQIANEGEDETDCSSSKSSLTDEDMHISQCTPASQNADAKTPILNEADRTREGGGASSAEPPPRDPRVRGAGKSDKGESNVTAPGHHSTQPASDDPAVATALPPSTTNTPLRKKGRTGLADNDEENDEAMKPAVIDTQDIAKNLKLEEDIPAGQASPKDETRGRSKERSPRANTISPTQTWSQRAEEEEQEAEGAEENEKNRRREKRESRKPGKSSKVAQRRRREEQDELEEMLGVRFCDLKWTRMDMRVLDRASVDRGFCPDTGFDIDDMKGYDGYTGYNWDDRYPFIKSKFEELAKKKKKKQKTEKSRAGQAKTRKPDGKESTESTKPQTQEENIT